MKTVLFRLLCLSGLLAGGFLLLCSWGILDPAQWQEDEEPGVLSAIPALGAADRSLYAGPFRYWEDPAQPVPAGTKGVVVPMKTTDGQLAYVSRLPLAIEWGSSSGDPTRNQAIRAVTGREDLHTVALISCLADGLAGQDLALLRESGSPWVDPSGQVWLDPAKEGTLAYLTEVCREVAALGFDEILLTNLACPREGEEEALELFCRELQKAALDWPCLLSVEAGQDLPEALLASFPGRVWTREENRLRLSAFDPVVLPVASSN